MDSLKDSYFHFDADTILSIRKSYNLDQPVRMEDAINILEEWVKKQDHFLKKDFSRDYLERLIIGNKGLLERTKIKLDNICTLRTLMPEFVLPCNTKDFDNINGKLIDAYMPNQLPNFERIYVLKIDVHKYTPEIYTNYYRRCVMYWEYLQAKDYSNGYHNILDFRNTNIMDAITKGNLAEGHRFSALGLGGYSFRTKAIHVISSSKFGDAFVSIFNQVTASKFYDRIKHHLSLESLHKEVPKELLPADYGGNEKPLSEMHEEFLKEVSSKEHMARLETMYEARIDESKRPVDKFNEHYLGIPGTFRKLVVD